ncbi:MAG: hypothetical protein ABIJ26_06185 [Candidatus Margulisiibacteriota bacterium]
MTDQIVKYDITDAAIAEMESIYLCLEITDIEDKEQFDAVHSARMTVKGKRVDVEKRRKELKADALAYGKLVDTEAKRITGKLEPIESHLDREEKKVTDEQKRIQAEADRKEKEKIDKRIAEFAEFNVHLPFFDVAAMTDGYFDSRLIIARADFEAEQNRQADEIAVRKAESERLEKVRKEQEAEAARLAEEKRKIDEAQAAERKKIDDERRAIEAEKKALEDEKRKEQERRDRAAFEAQAKEDARIAAEKVEKERQEREAWAAKEKADREAAEKIRQADLLPDKQKLLTFAEGLLKSKNDLIPDLKFGSSAYPILAECELQIDKAVKTLVEKTKEL